MRQVAIHLAWLIVIVYATIPPFWLIVHPFADVWRRQRNALPLLVSLWLIMMVAAAAITYPWHDQQLYETPWAWLLWLAFLLLAILGYRRVGRGFERATLIGLAELRPQDHSQRLVTTGVHARVRHPIYLAHWCMLTAWTILGGTVGLFALWVFAVITGIFMVRTEDAELEQRFGEQYRAYKRRVPAVFPRF
jgi:protein-S-isoprenylcysteine O-methyltransferase Ste14